MTKKKILVLPSWYSTAEAPTSGSFFHEQSLLMDQKDIGLSHWEVQVLTTEKFWISRQRHMFYQFVPSKISFSAHDQFLQPPSGKVLVYPFCKFASDSINLQREIMAFLNYFTLNPEKKPDLIHAHCTFLGGIIAKYLSKALHVPYILTEHMNPFLFHKYSAFWRTEITNALEGADAVLAVSEHQKQHLLMHEIKCDPIVTGNLVDDSRFKLPEINISSTTITNYLIVTFYPNFIKDMETFFDALELLKTSNQLENKHFTIVGGGEISGELEKNYYQNKIQELNVSNWVSVIPKANRMEMKALMENTDTLISTSISESFGVAICEAMLCGKPVITTQNGGVNDYVDSENSIVVPIKNPKALSEAICQFIERKSSFQPHVIREKIVKKYGKEAFRNRMDEIYLNVLKS